MTEKRSRNRLTPYQQLEQEGLPHEIIEAKLGVEPVLTDTPQRRSFCLSPEKINQLVESKNNLSFQEIEDQIK